MENGILLYESLPGRNRGLFLHFSFQCIYRLDFVNNYSFKGTVIRSFFCAANSLAAKVSAKSLLFVLFSYSGLFTSKRYWGIILCENFYLCYFMHPIQRF